MASLGEEDILNLLLILTVDLASIVAYPLAGSGCILSIFDIMQLRSMYFSSCPDEVTRLHPWVQQSVTLNPGTDC